MTQAWVTIFFGAQLVLLLVFCGYAFFHYLYGIAALRRADPRRVRHSDRRIAVVIVAHNEDFVVPGTIRACDNLTYKNRVIILADDSTDHRIVAEFKAEAIRRGCVPANAPPGCEMLQQDDGSTLHVPVEILQSPGFVYFHRSINAGFKGGVLQQLHRYLDAQGINFIYLLDADWHPQQDAVERCLEILEAAPEGAFVQTRRVAFRERMGVFQRYIALVEEACYYSDHEGRQALDHPVLFSGCCALLRLDAVSAVGGFPAGHLTEDLDLSDRLWINGWKGIYTPEVSNSGEVPFSYEDFRRQQERWAVGTARCLRRYTLPILRSSHLSWLQKFSAIRQNAYYFSSLIAMAVMVNLMVTLVGLYLGSGSYPAEYYLYLLQSWEVPVACAVYMCLVSNFVEPLVMILAKKRNFSDLSHLPMAIWFAWGTVPTYAVATLRGLFGKGPVWFRTPKYARNGARPGTRLPPLLRAIHVVLVLIVIALYWFSESSTGEISMYAFLWIPAFVVVALQ
jgi:cellulose synthase/poly-beta-1,6-N-acetylglucosamine synthase-like glycosyltransferase